MSKILVIDDDPMVRKAIGRILDRRGYDVVMAGDGRHGLKLFESEQPDLVITDIIMPEREGIETIRAIHKICPGAKIIAISGGGRVGNVDFLTLAAKLGAREIIAKPFDPSELTSSVSRCLGGAT
ncbi:MAG TPA: response regulator [Stellaceae bacterium]|nr:response regulator [Stellaceae bacterium]